MPDSKASGRHAGIAVIVALIVTLLLARSYKPHSMPANWERRLIISSDDAGMCSRVNSATIRGLQHGIICSASIMVCAPGFDEFASFASAHPEYDFGVHLTLTCDLPEQPWGPISRVADVPSLVDGEGHFWPNVAELSRHAAIEHVEQELRSQIVLARKSGIRVSHLDHHMFVLFGRPDLLDLYVRLAIEYRLPARISRSAPSPAFEQGPAGQDGSMWTESYRRAIGRLEDAGWPILDAVESANYRVEAPGKRDYHLQAMRDLPFGTTELIVHCSSAASPGPDPPDAARRVADTEFVVSPEARAELDRLGVRLTDWKGFQRSLGSSSR